jgi:hypothetical protein
MPAMAEPGNLGAMNTRLRRALLWTAVTASILVGFAFWYRATYSMNVVASFEVPGPLAGPHVLIATQGSKFKNRVVEGVVVEMRTGGIAVSVVDVSALDSTVEEAWDVIVVIHIWEMRKPPRPVQAFVDRARNKDRLVVLTTSGDGNFRLEGVDAISAASRDEDVAAKVRALVDRIDAVLTRRADRAS